jgi:acetyl-CoA carboxylase carboxyltransferase component
MLRNDEKIRKAKEVFNKIEEEVLFLSTFKKEIQDNTRVEYKLIESIEKKYYDMIDSSNHMFDISYMNQFQKEFDERMVGVKYLLKKYAAYFIGYSHQHHHRFFRLR